MNLLDLLYQQMYKETFTGQGVNAVIDSDITPVGMYKAPKLPGQNYQYPMITDKEYPNSYFTQRNQIDPRFKPADTKPRTQLARSTAQVASSPQTKIPYKRNGKTVFVNLSK